MNTDWIARAVLATILIYAGAMAVERVMAWFGRSRRWIWLAGMMGAIALPVLSWRVPDIMPALGIDIAGPGSVAAPSLNVPVTTKQLSATAVEHGPVALPAAPSLSLGAATWIGTSAALMILALAVGGRLALLRSRAHPSIIDGVAVRVTRDLGPLVAGFLQPTILLPAWVVNTTESERRLILLHEREHIAGGDHWLVPCSALLVIAMPWNPGLWMLYARLRLAIETDCDARVVAAGVDRREYGAALIRVAGSAGPHSVLSPAWTNRARQLEQRVRAMTATSPRARVLRSAFLSIGAVVLVTAACDAASPDPIVSQRATRPEPPPVRLHLIAMGPEPEKRPPRAVTSEAVAMQRQLRSQLVDVGAIRVTGYTRSAIRTRVHFDGRVGRLVVLSGNVIRMDGDSAVDVVTPATFRIEGDAMYRVVATSQESGAEVEIAAVFPDNAGFPTMGTARGPYPGVRFPGSERIADPVEARRHAMESLRRLPAPEVDLSTRTPEREMEAGEIRVDSESGARIRVRIRFQGGRFNVSGPGIFAVADGSVVEASTPFIVNFTAGEDFGVVFFAVDSTHRINAVARGATGNPFVEMRGNYSAALAICSRQGVGAGITGAKWGSTPAEACKP